MTLDYHNIGDSNCESCESQLKSYRVDTFGSFPKLHSCGGYIHIEIELQGDEGWESPYSSFTCENCGSLSDDEIDDPPTLGINVSETINTADKFG